MPDENFESRLEERKKIMKEKAKEYRRKAYEKAKNSPAAIARKAKMKELRQDAYRKAKEARKAREEQRKQELATSSDEERSARDRALMEFLMAASEVPTSPPHLRLIRGGKQ